MAFNVVEHNQLVFVAARLGAPTNRCCDLTDVMVAAEVCARCKDGRVSQVFSVHDHEHCWIGEHPCLILRYCERMAAGEKGFYHTLTNCLTPWERDYAVYIVAQRSHELAACNREFGGLLGIACQLCRQNRYAWLPNVHEDGDCLGTYEGTMEQDDLARKCWVHRASSWRFDGYRLERIEEYV